MKLEDQVVSLDLARRLKELGVKQDSFVTWDSPHKDRLDYPDTLVFTGSINRSEPQPRDRYAAAFTVAELLDLLPDGCSIQRSGIMEANYVCWKIHTYSKHSETAAKGLAKMLIYLIEQGILKP